jgi:hypothetical protein
MGSQPKKSAAMDNLARCTVSGLNLEPVAATARGHRLKWQTIQIFVGSSRHKLQITMNK